MYLIRNSHLVPIALYDAAKSKMTMHLGSPPCSTVVLFLVCWLGVCWLGYAGAAHPAEPNGELLYNGIRLPTEWPPRDGDPKSDAPLPVPYLNQRPDVTPIDVGRQLLVDDFLIERTDLTRTFHRPQRHPQNPVFKPETPHELTPPGIEGNQQAVTYLGHGGLFFDPADALFKMYYTAGWRGGLALATSKDMLHWRRPELGLAGGNLLLAKGWKIAGGDNSIWLDIHAQDPAERLKFLTDHGKGRGHTLYTSPDGRTWSAGKSAGKAGDYCSFFYNPFRQKWIFSIKQDGPRGRSRWYAESDEFLAGADWSKSVYWTNADRLDPPDPAVGDKPQLYSLSAAPYESLMLGMFAIHRGPSNVICARGKFPKRTDLHVGFSRDGFHWDRPDREPFLAATGREGDWDRGYLHTTTGVMVVLDDQLVFPYCGYSGEAPNGTRGMYTGASIGLATLRRDGFASLDAGAAPGELVTRPLSFQGNHLFVNVDCPDGELRIEVLNREGELLKPFRLADCQVIKVDSTRHRVTWQGADDLASRGDEPVRLRFQLQNGKLYSFWVTNDREGASGGYLAAGSPAHQGVQDTPRATK